MSNRLKQRNVERFQAAEAFGRYCRSREAAGRAFVEMLVAMIRAAKAVPVVASECNGAVRRAGGYYRCSLPSGHDGSCETLVKPYQSAADED